MTQDTFQVQYCSPTLGPLYKTSSRQFGTDAKPDPFGKGISHSSCCRQRWPRGPELLLSFWRTGGNTLGSLACTTGCLVDMGRTVSSWPAHVELAGNGG